MPQRDYESTWTSEVHLGSEDLSLQGRGGFRCVQEDHEIKMNMKKFKRNAIDGFLEYQNQEDPLKQLATVWSSLAK